MSKISRSELRTRFQTGKVPTQQDWDDFFDSFVHKDEQAAVDMQVVNTGIAAYDTALNVQNHNGHVDSLGDVLLVFNSLDDTKSIQANNVLKYSLDTTQITDTSTLDPTSASGQQIEKWVGQDLFAAGNTYQDLVIRDIKIQRKQLSISGATFFVDRITAIRLGVNPLIKLQP